MNKKSTGILAWRNEESIIRVLPVHPGRAFFIKKDIGGRLMPNAKYAEDEPLTAPRRKFAAGSGSETSGEFTCLGAAKQKAVNRHMPGL